MYIGSTDGRGLLHCLWEIIDNAVDEALAGHCTGSRSVLHADHSAEVRDNGRGIPVDVEPKTGLTGVELVMTRLHAGGKFGGGSYTASGGLHGVGASVVNALAGQAGRAVDQGGRKWAVSFRHGVPGEFGGPGPGRPVHPGHGLRRCGRVARIENRYHGQVLARSADLHPRGTPAELRRSHAAGPGRPPTWCPGSPSGSATRPGGTRRPDPTPTPIPSAGPGRRERPGADAGPEEKPSSASTGESASSASYLSPGEPLTGRAPADRRPPVHRDGAGAGRAGPHDPHGCGA